MNFDPNEQLDRLKCSCGYEFDREELGEKFEGECAGIEYECNVCGAYAAEFISDINPMCDDEPRTNTQKSIDDIF